MGSVLQDWVMDLPLRAQGTLLTGIRGCDLAPKPSGNWHYLQSGECIKPEEPIERQLVAFLRYLVMIPADPREVGVPGAFFQRTCPQQWKASQLGHYPQHWYSHLMHCFEVCGYCHPNTTLRTEAIWVYRKLVRNMHLEHETMEAMFERLTEDRIATGTVVS